MFRKFHTFHYPALYGFLTLVIRGITGIAPFEVLYYNDQFIAGRARGVVTWASDRTKQSPDDCFSSGLVLFMLVYAG